MSHPTDHPGVRRVLDAAGRKGVTLDVVAFDESTHTAQEAAAAVGADLGQIVKSLVFVVPRDDGGQEPVVCLVSGRNRVDLARLAAVTGEQEIRRATAREAYDLTGFSIGGIPPIGFERPDARDHGSGSRSLSDGLGRRRAADRGVRGAAGDAAHPVERDGGARSPRCSAPPTPRPPPPGRDGRSRPEPTATRTVAEPRNATVTYPGGLRARWRWGGSGQSAAVFALSEAGGTLVDLGPRVSTDPDALCRAELRLEGPRGAWSARFASTIHDEPRGLYWDTAGSAGRGLRLPHVRAGRRDRARRAGTTARRPRSWRYSGRPASPT